MTNENEVRTMAYDYAMKCVGSGPYLNMIANTYIQAHKQGCADTHTNSKATDFEIPARDYSAELDDRFQAGTAYAAYMAGVKAVLKAVTACAPLESGTN